VCVLIMVLIMIMMFSGAHMGTWQLLSVAACEHVTPSGMSP
jgi:hypothetical protein